MTEVKEMYALAFQEGKTVVIAKATQERDHGEPFWLCQLMPPSRPAHQSVVDRKAALEWLSRNGAESIVEGRQLSPSEY